MPEKTVLNLNPYKTQQYGIISAYLDDSYYKTRFEGVLESQIPDEKSRKQMIKVVIPYVRHITDSLSILYNKPVNRVINTENEQIIDIFKMVVNKFKEKSVLIDKYTFLAGMTAVKPHIHEDGTFEYLVYTGDMVSYLSDYYDIKKVKEINLEYFINDVKQEEIWSKDKFIKYVDDSQYIEDENPYGFIPFTIFRNAENEISWYCPPKYSLLETQDMVSLQMTHVYNLVKYQTASMLVAKGVALESLNIGANAINMIPTDADLKFIKPDTNVEEVLTAINKQLQIMNRTHNIPDALYTGATSMSGISLMVNQKVIDEYLRGRAILFNKYEEEAILQGMKVVGTHLGIDIPDDLRISISYSVNNTASYLTKDEVELWSFYFENGIYSPVDLIMRLNPNMTRKEAEETYNKNKNQYNIIETQPKEGENNE